jgi:hypothetical protein
LGSGARFGCIGSFGSDASGGTRFEDHPLLEDVCQLLAPGKRSQVPAALRPVPPTKDFVVLTAARGRSMMLRAIPTSALGTTPWWTATARLLRRDVWALATRRPEWGCPRIHGESPARRRQPGGNLLRANGHEVLPEMDLARRGDRQVVIERGSVVVAPKMGPGIIAGQHEGYGLGDAQGANDPLI